MQVKREDFITALEGISPEDIVVLDECGANEKMARDYARAYGGERARAPKPHCPGKKYSIIGAISLEGIEAIVSIEGAVDGALFEEFIKRAVVPIIEGKYLVLDNVKFHKSEAIEQLITGAGGRVVFLPPYSPELSPIEKMWSKIKGILKACKARTEEAFQTALTFAVHQVTTSDIAAWYIECGYAV